MKEICALLLAGSMGAGSVVAVQKAKPAISKTRAKPAKVHKAADRTVQRTAITDCPTAPVVPAVGVADFNPLLLPPGPESLLTPQQLASGHLDPGGPLVTPLFGGGGSGPSVIPAPPTGGVPQPDTWVMMVAGFGFIGLALRRPSRASRSRA